MVKYFFVDIYIIVMDYRHSWSRSRFTTHRTCSCINSPMKCYCVSKFTFSRFFSNAVLHIFKPRSLFGRQLFTFLIRHAVIHQLSNKTRNLVTNHFTDKLVSSLHYFIITETKQISLF